MRLANYLVCLCICLLFAAPGSAQDPGEATDGTRPKPGVGTIVKEMPRDLWRFVSLDTGLVLAGGGATAAVAHIWDDDLAQEVETSVRLNDALAPGNTYGSFGAQVAIGVGIYSVGRLANSSKLVVTGADIMRAQLVSQLWVQALKFTTQRTRPDGSDDHSFPSGHSASAFATAAVPRF